MSEAIQTNSTVTMHFDIRLKDGSIADSTHNVGKPMTFNLGQGIFSEKMESELLGMSKGDKKKIMLMPEEAFGQPHPANIFQVPRNRFAGTDFEKDIEPGLIISFTQKNGSQIPGTVVEADEHEVTIDFNHPLSGQVVLFDVEILDVA